MKIELLTLLHFALLNASLVFVGYVLVKRQQLLLSWLLLLLGVGDVYFAFAAVHPIIQMLAIIATTFTGMKVIAVICEYKGKAPNLTMPQWLAFAVGWVGMRAKPFETLGGKPVPQAWPIIKFGVSRVIAGAAVVLLAHQVVGLPWNTGLTYTLVSIMLLVGFSLILHFGLLGISAGTWRLAGVNTYVLFRQPAKATSLAEFWGKRWNLAFSEMTSMAIFRPLKNKTGGTIALMLAFLFSGLLHELALSIPVHSGYGLPTLYFFIQGTAVLVEKALVLNKFTFVQHWFWARAWVFFWLILPMPLLFHEQFIKQIVWPLAGLSL
ncbi:membrane bound O-acyl transferase family-domain-containing protein [Mucilaginibacter galii]|uniref:Wax synthase domain-containing protein n=1 Tax=Mucilaginibacter galii TaxID=2005073 RepID=A0A917J996_9SPHI|nr:membrane bound O-acyl transferase family-domain-containing protein [Mucilaginibacter galii]GGI50265.1 hypothetical protein GCM10011425_14770 [Mucilaginibacter galii]